MYIFSRFYFFVLSILCLPAWTYAQTKLTDKDVQEIQSKAKGNISELENLMNFITFNAASPTEIQSVIERSYTAASNNHLFFNKRVVVEDDITPGFNKDNTKDLEADKYLNTLDVYYEKTADPSIHFTKVQVSNVKKKDYLYVKVLFESKFDGKFKKSSATYPARQRMAMIRADKIGYSWQTRIIGITFYDPFKPITSTENDVQVVSTNPYADEKQPDLSYERKESYEKKEITPTPSSAQRAWNLGIKLGFASSTWVGDVTSGNELGARAGGVAGIYIRYYGKRYSHIGFGMDFLYVDKGATVTTNRFLTGSYTKDYALSYVEVPILINFFILGKDRFKPYINLGYAPALLIAATEKTEGSSGTIDRKDVFRRYDGNIILGLGADCKVSRRNRMTFDLRFELSTMNAASSNALLDFVEPDQITQGSLSLSVGYAFGL